MAIVLPPITAWAKGHLASILTATTTTDFNSAFDAFLSKHATITVNGQHVSRDQYKQQLLGESTVGNLKQSTSIEFNGVVEVPTDQEQLVKAGLVGAFYVATTNLREKVFGAPAQTQIISSLNIQIEQDTTLPQPPAGPIRGFFDGRRVTTLNQVFIAKAVEITPPHSDSTT